MGFGSATEAYSLVYQKVLLALSIEATRGMAHLRISRLGTALSGNASSKQKARRQQSARDEYFRQSDVYSSRYAFFDV